VEQAAPSGSSLDLSDTTPGIYLHRRSALGDFQLASDSVMQTFTRWNFDYLEIFHNRQRRQSSLGMLSPIEHEIRHANNRACDQAS